MGKYNWRSHYSEKLVLIEEGENYKKYKIENDTGYGYVSEWKTFPGVQIVFNNLFMERCSKKVPLQYDVIQISYCVDGCYEYDADDDHSFIIGSGDLSVGAVGRLESQGCFPKKQYCGFTLFIEKNVFEQNEARILEELHIDLDKIGSLTGLRKQRFILHRDEESYPLAELFLSGVQPDMIMPSLRLKILELMSYLSNPDIEAQGVLPKYISRDQAKLAMAIQKRITIDITEHITIEQLKDEFKVGTTTIKNVFKKVYGTSIYAYQKDCRLKEARRLLQETDIPITEIAIRIGYVNPGKFSMSFKEKFGESPLRYRNRSYRSMADNESEI